MFVALGMSHAMRMPHIVTCRLPGSTILSHVIHKRHDFRIKVIEYKMCVLLFSTTFV